MSSKAIQANDNQSQRDKESCSSSDESASEESDGSSSECSSGAETIRCASTSGVELAHSSDQKQGGAVVGPESEGSEGGDSEDTASTVSDPPYLRGGIIRKRLLPPRDALTRSETRIRKYLRKNKVDAAMAEYVRCVALSRLEFGSHHWRTASAVASLAQAYIDLRGFVRQALHHAEQAKNTVLNNQPTAEESQANTSGIMSTMFTIYLTLARGLTDTRKLKEAAQNFSKARKLLDQIKHSQMVADHQCLEWDIKLHAAWAKYNEFSEDFRTAADAHRHVLKLNKKLHGERSGKLIKILQDIGKCEQSQKNHDAAISLYEEARTLAVGKNELSCDAARATHSLAKAHILSGRDGCEEVAESFLHECLSTYKALYGSRQEETLKLQDELVRLMIRTKREHDALHLLQLSLPGKVQVCGEYSRQVADTYKLMGSIHLSWGDLDRAANYMKKCYQVEEVVYGLRHKKTQATVHAINVIRQDSSQQAANKSAQRPPFLVSTARSLPSGSSPLV